VSIIAGGPILLALHKEKQNSDETAAPTCAMGRQKQDGMLKRILVRGLDESKKSTPAMVAQIASRKMSRLLLKDFIVAVKVHIRAHGEEIAAVCAHILHRNLT
jgi:hypothetical protein